MRMGMWVCVIPYELGEGEKDGEEGVRASKS